ncbi:MAG: helicase-exonuclease AddAB subunit AddB [Lachnospiraceae bacterium]|nr:helicase-exonuclease AddAB subunit AddB [Lachnospiraceae bacterium]
MSLQIIAGNSGSGKSQYIYEKIVKEAIRHPEQKFLILVPEQFNMQTQKRLTTLHPGGCLLNIDVLSFNRLAYRIFQEVGGKQQPILEDCGKSLVIQKVVWENRKKLKVLGSTMKKPGAVEEMKSLISEFMQYGIGPEDLESWVQGKDQKGKSALLAAKLVDVEKIYQGFVSYLESRYLTTEEVPEALSRVIGQSEWMANCSVVLDGYTGFTPVQIPLVRQLLVHCRKVWAVVTLEEGKDPLRQVSPANLFYMSRQMVKRLTELAAESHVETEEICWVSSGGKSRFAANPSLAYLEKQLFRPGKRKGWMGEANIRIAEAMTPEQELIDIAEQILYQVRENHLCYRDLAVVTGDLPGYGRLAEQIFRKAGIPVFIDQNYSILHSPLVEYIRASIDLVVRNYSYESVVRYLRSGLSGFSKEEADALDQYLLALGIRGKKKYEEFWTRTFRGMREEKLLEINALRQWFLQEVSELTDRLKVRKSTFSEKTEALVYFLIRGRVQKRLLEQAERFSLKGDITRASEYEQIYQKVMDLLNKAVEILGDEKMGLTEYQQILDALFREESLGLIPPGGDQVLVGDIERSRLSSVKVLFFAGLNEGIVPKSVTGGGLLSESDRDYLKGKDVALAPGERERMYQQRFYLYLNMTKPSDQLFLSYSKMDTSGSARLPSYLIGVIRKLFPQVETENRTEIWDTSSAGLLNLETEVGRLQLLLEGFQNPEQAFRDPVWKELYSWFRNCVEHTTAEKMLEAAFFEKQDTRLSKAVARAMYGDVLQGSVTRLEQYAACAYAHFLQYGLKLQERPVYEISPADLGNVLHNSLDVFSETLRKNRMRWSELDAATRKKMADAALEAVVHDQNNTIFHASSRNAYMITRMSKMLQCTVEVLQEQILAGEFEPWGFEVRFPSGEMLESTDIPLQDGASMKLQGRIDRLDLLEKDDTIYVKVIDYKTGKAELDLASVYYGLQLQLTVYMRVALEQQKKRHPDKDVQPAGAFLYHIENPFVEDEEKELSSKLKMGGLARGERETAALMDRKLLSGGKSQVIPVGYNKDGKLSAGSSACEEEDFRTVCQYVGNKVQRIGQEIMDGEIAINPYRLNNKNACEFCRFNEVCSFDRRLPGYEFRKLNGGKPEEILNKMKEEM